MVKLKPCPKCNSTRVYKCHSILRPQWWHIECWNCHWSGKTKLFLFRAIKSWNKETRTQKDMTKIEHSSLCETETYKVGD